MLDVSFAAAARARQLDARVRSSVVNTHLLVGDHVSMLAASEGVADTLLGGQQIKAGQRVGLFYRSANFDEEVFDHPGRFDILRDPNPHLGFGGLGTHYCLGANLAKLEIELIFTAIADAIPDIAKAGDPVRLRSGWINGIKQLPVSYRG